MITKNDLIQGWNNAGTKLNADLLGLVFKEFSIQQPVITVDVANHNLIMSHINERIGEHGVEFTKRVADLIEEISLRNIENVQNEGK